MILTMYILFLVIKLEQLSIHMNLAKLDIENDEAYKVDGILHGIGIMQIYYLVILPRTE